MSAEARIRSLPIWETCPTLEPVPTGRTNRNFIVRCGGRRYFARAGEDLPHHRISRTAEARCAALAAMAGIGPAVLHAQNGILVTAYIEGQPLSRDALHGTATLARLAGVLRKLHAIPPPADLPVFDPAGLSRFYVDQLGGALTPDERRRFQDILEAAPDLPARSLIHADLIPENFIDDGDRLWLVDWEYAGRGDPATDLAMVATNLDLSDALRRQLVEEHGLSSAALVEALGPIVAAREALWCLTQIEVAGPQGDLAAYTRSCLARVGLDR